MYVDHARSEMLNGTNLMMGMVRFQVRSERERDRERDKESAARAIERETVFVCRRDRET